jgi:hypothetical protein
MEQRGSDQRAGDKNSAIARAHGDAECRTLRKIYGKAFAEGFPDQARLSEVLEHLDAKSRSELQGHYDDGSLERRIAKPARFLNFTNAGGLVG